MGGGNFSILKKSFFKTNDSLRLYDVKKTKNCHNRLTSNVSIHIYINRSHVSSFHNSSMRLTVQTSQAVLTAKCMQKDIFMHADSFDMF